MLFPIALVPLLHGCAGAPAGPGLGASTRADRYDSKWGVSSSERIVTTGPIPKGGGHYKLGRPYQVGGKWYVPRHEPSYDHVGVGSWYGHQFHGRKTANGEIFDMNALTAAHPTLPMPSYAYVTNLRNGRTLLVRINDRGPYVADREIDLSRASAQALGYADGGLGRVRVRWAGHAPIDGDDSREQSFLQQQPWHRGRPQPNFDRRLAPMDGPVAERRDERSGRYTQDMSRRDEPRPGPGSWQTAGERRGYDQDRAWQPPHEPQQRYDDRPQALAPRYAEVEERQLPRAEPRGYEPDFAVAPPSAPQSESMWSPFEHRDQLKPRR